MDEHRQKKNYAGAVSSFAMRASCFCSWSSCRRSCSAPTVFSCWSASTPFRMPSSLSNDGIEFLIQLLLHGLANGFQNDVCLLGEEFIQLLVKPFFELAEFGV